MARSKQKNAQLKEELDDLRTYEFLILRDYAPNMHFRRTLGGYADDYSNPSNR